MVGDSDYSSREALVLAEVPRRLAPLRPRRIVLFGSRAEGVARPDSDFDLAVVMDPVDPALPRSAPVRRCLRGLGVPFDVVVFTPAEWAEYRRNPLALAHEIDSKGRVLLDAA